MTKQDIEKETRPEFTFSKYAFLFVFSLGIAVAMGMMMYMKKSNPPHIVFILADDLGWNDIGWNNPIIKTPVLDSLAREGVIFNQTYSQPVCTPTRAALMTGYYPFHIGMQQKIITFSQGSGLPLKLKLLPQKLKEVGYITHLVGKWHLGYCNWAYTPLQRGFDSAYGNLGGLLSHVTKMGRGMVGGDASWYGYDFRDNTGVVQDDGTYSTILLASRAVDIISKHYPAYPLFLYFSIDQPAKGYDVPSEYAALYENIENEQVRNYYAKISLMDDAIGNVTQALKSRGMWDKTLLVFISDNGAFYFTQGTNLPLRGAASTLYEGGTRVPAMAHGTMLTKTGYVNNQLNHITDWHTSLLRISGIEPEPDLDGMDILDTILNGNPSPRTEFIYNIDECQTSPGAAIRIEDWKLITGNPDMTYPAFNSNDTGDWLQPGRSKINLGDGSTPPLNITYLFNLKDDPTEHHNLADIFPEKVLELQNRLDEYRQEVVAPIDMTMIPDGHPDNHGGVFTPGWC